MNWSRVVNGRGEILLQGAEKDRVAYVDPLDMPRVLEHHWRFDPARKRVVNGCARSLGLFILGKPTTWHRCRNGNQLDCRRENLEVGNVYGSASVVKTYRGGRLCGYEVWRHLSGSRHRPKARLWFGIKAWRTELGYDGAALDIAEAAARRINAMSLEQLRNWWTEHQRNRVRALQVPAKLRRAIPPEFEGVRLDYDDLGRMSHVYPRLESNR